MKLMIEGGISFLERLGSFGRPDKPRGAQTGSGSHRILAAWVQAPGLHFISSNHQRGVSQ